MMSWQIFSNQRVIRFLVLCCSLHGTHTGATKDQIAMLSPEV